MRGDDLKIVAERLRQLRESVKLSQVKMGEIIGVKQTSVNRYETEIASPSLETLTRYADFFDVSLDYVFGRTDNPRGKLYKNMPKIALDDVEKRHFIDMCFDPKSPMYERLKAALVEMLSEDEARNEDGGADR